MIVTGPWSIAEIAEFLDDARIPVRLSVIGEAGYPLVISLWFLAEDGALWCATSATSSVVRALEGNPRCAFEVAADKPPYHGVRGQAVASMTTDSDRTLLSRLIRRYLGDEDGRLARWLLGRKGEEVSIRIDPVRIMSWDYRERMKVG